MGAAAALSLAAVAALTLAPAAGPSAGTALPAGIPGWPWWGPRVQVGERTFRPGVRPSPHRLVRLVVWDVVQPSEQGPRWWEEVLREGVRTVRRRYPGLEAEVRLFRWREIDGALEQALSRGEPPDVLGTTDATYLFDRGRQVPLNLYLQHTTDPALRAEMLPGALALASDGSTLWGIPRWVEWAGWVARRRPGVRDKPGSLEAESTEQLAIDLANPLTWRLLAETVPASPTRAPQGQPTSTWEPERVHAAARWVQAARRKLVDPWRVAQEGVLEPLRRGEAWAAGPISGRLAYRLGLWPADPHQKPSGESGLEGVELAGGAEAGLPPGPLLSASSFVLFVRPETDDERLRLAWELAVQLARLSSQVMAHADGVIPAWNPHPDSSSAVGLGSATGPLSSGPASPFSPVSRVMVNGSGAWWDSYPFPPGAAPLVTRSEPPALLGHPAGRDGARPWSDSLHQHGPVAQAALSLARGRMSLDAFTRQVAR